MKIKVRHLQRMLSLLSEKTHEPIDRSGLRNMAAEIGGIGEDYLYKKIYYELWDLVDDDELSLRDAQLNSIARFLGYKNISALVASLELPLDEQLQSLIGCYYIYMRQNSSKGLVFQSPVEIRVVGSRFSLTLQGPTWTYEGDLKIRHGCLFILMVSPEDKSFYHIYKIGTRRNPHVIQGIFSGVSTAFDPIGGRAVLLRVEQSFAELKNHAFSLDELQHSTQPEHRMLAGYFREYSRNNLSINKVVSFGLEDLEE